ncbi:hypothetical protein ES703_32019 [subsurface metagenome]
MKRLDASYYDEDYFRPGPKSNYILPFTWQVEGPNRLKVAQYLKDTFNPKKALDVGCAKGFLCKALLQVGIDAYGCDISEFAVNNCEPEVKGRLKVADIRDGLPYPKNSFDFVCSHSTLEHIEMEFLPYVTSEIARVARNWVNVSIPVNLDNVNSPWGDPSHRTFMTVSYWISLFYSHRLLCDLRFCSQGNNHPFYNANLVFSRR